MRIFRLSLLLFIFCTFLSNAQEVHFYKEDITFKIQKDTFYVNGTYFLRSEKKKQCLVVYPYPVDSIYGKVDFVMILDMSTGQLIRPVKNEPGGTFFLVPFDSAGQAEIRISYRQKLFTGQAEYILLTTQVWREKLEEATYQLICPKEQRVSSFSYEPDKCIETGKSTLCTWEKHDFMPSMNMVFRFEPKN